ncbi:MAG: SAM-dependent methyltransferase [Pseudomonadota bacterium]
MSLEDQIIARIAANGPISIADYMTECLLHPELGYYTAQNPFGRSGDFITAPDISQVFGELIGLCLAQAWLDQGRPDRFILAELGPGRGTLMKDALRATATVPGFLEASHLVLIEASPRLRQIQQETLAGHPVSFEDRAEDLAQAPLFFVANEFFDALPIRQFQRSGNGWRERQVGLDGEILALGLGPIMAQPALRHRLEDTAEGDIIEDSPTTAPVISELTSRIRQNGGAGLVIDYGDWRSKGDTLQAVRAHSYVDILEAPGTCDLTAHVDFEALALASRCPHSKLTPQGVFLERLGITARSQALARHLSGEALDTHVSAHRRLTHPDEMGNLFKVFGFFPDGAAPPAGLDL